MQKTVGIIATLDTKGSEVCYLKDKIKASNVDVCVIDSGTGGTPIGIDADISRVDIAESAGFSYEKIEEMGRGEAAEVMGQALKKTVHSRYREGKLHALLSIGGGDGALLASAAMQQIPLGVPKMIVTPIAQGQEKFGPYIGTSDITIMHSVIDILGINQVSRKIYDNAAGCVVGMLGQASTDIQTKRPDKVIAITMYGTTTPAVMKAKIDLESKGHEVVVFHPNGTGGKAMEDMVTEGLFCGVLDMTTHEISDHLFDGCHAGRSDRLEVAGKNGVPQVVVPGGIDFLIKGPQGSLTEEMKHRSNYFFNAAMTLVRVNGEEMKIVGEVMASKLNGAKGPTTLMIPLKGFSKYAKKGHELYDPESDKAFIDSVKSNLNSNVRLVEIDAHINDPVFAEKTAQEMVRIIG